MNIKIRTQDTEYYKKKRKRNYFLIIIILVIIIHGVKGIYFQKAYFISFSEPYTGHSIGFNLTGRLAILENLRSISLALFIFLFFVIDRCYLIYLQYIRVAFIVISIITYVLGFVIILLLH